MIVVDASALVDLLAPEAPDPELESRLLSDGDLHAPHLVDVEVASALRRMTTHESLGVERAADALLDIESLAIARYPHWPLLWRAWELRHSLRVNDAMYVALAEALDAPLVTCDARLGHAHGFGAAVEVYPPKS